MLFYIVMLVIIFIAFLLRLGHSVLKMSPAIPGPQKTDQVFKRNTTIPGPKVIDPLKGNLAELAASGSLHEFVRDLHQTYGPITSFWLGPKFCVSVASPELLKELANTFDRPKELFVLLEPLLTKYSIQYSNGVEGRKRHTAYSRCFSHESLQKRYHILQKHSAEFCNKLACLAPEEHIPLSEKSFEFSIRSILAIAFGRYFSDSKQLLKFKNAYEFTWSAVECRIVGGPDPSGEEKFEKCRNILRTMLRNAAEQFQNNETDSDMFAQGVQKVNQSPEIIDADMLIMCIAGLHTVGFLLTWCLYFLATNPNVQEKLYEEVSDLVGDEEIPFEAINRMVYLKQVLDETLRCAILSPYAARVKDSDIVLGGHKVPAGTPVVQALGVMFADEKIWPQPDKFDPERFNAENRKSIPKCCFEPFGFAGKRKCPGHRLAYLEARVLLGDLVRKFKIKMVEGHLVQPVYGLVTKPKEEIWITLEKRK